MWELLRDSTYKETSISYSLRDSFQVSGILKIDEKNISAGEIACIGKAISLAKFAVAKACGGMNIDRSVNIGIPL